MIARGLIHVAHPLASGTVVNWMTPKLMTYGSSVHRCLAMAPQSSYFLISRDAIAWIERAKLAPLSYLGSRG